MAQMGNYYKDIQDVQGMMPNQVQRIPMPPRTQASQPVQQPTAPPVQQHIQPKKSGLDAIVQFLLLQKKKPIQAKKKSQLLPKDKMPLQQRLPMAPRPQATKPSQSFADRQKNALQQAILAHFGIGQ